MYNAVVARGGGGEREERECSAKVIGLKMWISIPKMNAVVVLVHCMQPPNQCVPSFNAWCNDTGIHTMMYIHINLDVPEQSLFHQPN